MAKPPGPVVSWPSTPCRRAMRSSSTRPSSLPTRMVVTTNAVSRKAARASVLSSGPLGVSSANRSGQPPAATMVEARLQLGASIAVYLDGGRSGPQVPSSIVDLTGTAPRLLRAGALDADALRAVVPDLITEP